MSLFRSLLIKFLGENSSNSTKMKKSSTAKAKASRKGSKAWRKNIDVSTIEKGLDNVRQQRIEGGIVAEKANNQLFAVDTKGDNSIIQKERLGKRLRADEILAIKSAVAPVSTLNHRNSALGTGIVHKKRKGPLPPSELKRLRKIVNRGSEKAPAKILKDTYDVWDQPAPVQPTSEWVKPEVAKRAPATYGQAPENLMTGERLPAVQVADPGQSYNPAIDEWTDFVEKKAAEQLKLNEEHALHNAPNRAAYAEDERFEMPVVLDKDVQSEEEDEDEVAEEILTKPDPRGVPKTRAQRNKEARKRAHAAQLAQKLAAKEFKKSFASLGEIIEQQDLTTAEKTELIESVKAESSLRPHKFGKHAIPKDPLDIQLSDELSESLRLLKPEGNLFKDRFMSLLKRGIIEARVPRHESRRYELITKEKFSHKYDRGLPFMENY